MKVKNDDGLTLVEVLIALSILAFISIYTAQSIRSAIGMKGKLGREIDGISLVRDATKIMQMDIGKAFNYQNIHVELYNKAQEHRKELKQKATQPSTKTNTNAAGTNTNGTNTDTANTGATNNTSAAGVTSAQSTFSYEPKVAKTYTHFIGDKEKINFASLSNIRTREEQKISDQAEIGYSLKNCKSQFDKSKSSKCLWRRSANIIDDKPEEGGTESVLLEGIKEFELKYYHREKEEWLSSWDSKESLDPTIKGRFPDAVEIKLTIALNYKGKDKDFSLTAVTPLKFTNNPSKEDASATNSTTTQSTDSQSTTTK